LLAAGTTNGAIMVRWQLQHAGFTYCFVSLEAYEQPTESLQQNEIDTLALSNSNLKMGCIRL